MDTRCPAPPRTPTVVIAAGGTGGHIYPGLALARALRELSPGAAVTFVGTRRGLEGRLVAGAGWPLRFIDMVPFAGWRTVVAPFALARSTLQARSLLKELRADVAVGMGGYTSIPLVLGARLASVPAVIHESNAVAGRANLLSARATPNVALSWENGAGRFLRSADRRVVGMPLSPELEGFDRGRLRSEARAAFGVGPDVAMLLVSGGSQGAASLNRLAVGLAERWRGRKDIRILLKPGPDHVREVRVELARTGGDAVCTAVGYFDRIDHAYAAADLAVTRAGAGTVAELAACGLPAVLVPYSHHADGHQALNAGVLVEAGAAVMVRDAEATPDLVAPTIEKLLADLPGLERMAARARIVARPDAARRLASWVLDLAAAARAE